MVDHRVQPVVIVLVGALLLAGCAVLRGPPPATTFLAPAERHLRLAGGFDAAKSGAVAYRDPSEYEEYQRALGDGRAEAILSIANGRQTALDFETRDLDSLTRGWAFNRGRADVADWQAQNRAVFGERSYRWARYTRRADGVARACLAFARRWAWPPDDPRHRPGRALFGYYCAPAGQRLDDTRAAAVLRGIDVEPGDVPRVYFGESRTRDPAALAAARGRRSGDGGHRDFPLRFSRYYRIDGARGGLD